MMDERTHELIQRGVDGTLSDSDRLAFERLLATNPEAHQYYRHVQGLADRVKAVPEVSPPSHLFATVMQSLRTAETVALERAGISPWRRFRNAFAGRPVYTYAAGVVSGALVLTCFLIIGRGFEIDGNSRAGGTMAPIESAPTHADITWPIQEGAISGIVQGRYSGNLLELHIALTSPEGVLVRLGAFEGSAGGVLRVVGADGNPIAASIDRGLTVPVPAGHGEVNIMVSLNDTHTARQLEILTGEQVVARLDIGGRDAH